MTARTLPEWIGNTPEARAPARVQARIIMAQDGICACRHGFATLMLRAGYDVKTVALMGGWKDASIVLRTYAHAIEDRTVTDAVFDTKYEQSRKRKTVRS